MPSHTSAMAAASSVLLAAAEHHPECTNVATLIFIV